MSYYSCSQSLFVICSRRYFQVLNFMPISLLSSGYSRHYLPVLDFTPRRSPSTITIVKPRRRSKNVRRHALPYGLVMKCLRRPRNKPQRLVGPEKPVRWRWKKRKFGLAEVQPCIGLEPSTLDKFCSYDHDFLALP